MMNVLTRVSTKNRHTSSTRQSSRPVRRFTVYKSGSDLFVEPMPHHLLNMRNIVSVNLEDDALEFESVNTIARGLTPYTYQYESNVIASNHYNNLLYAMRTISKS